MRLIRALPSTHHSVLWGCGASLCYYLITLDTFCRPKAVVDLLAHDVSLPNGAFPRGLRLRSTGRYQSVAVRHPLAPAALQVMLNTPRRRRENCSPSPATDCETASDVITPARVSHGNTLSPRYFYSTRRFVFWNAIPVPMHEIVARRDWACQSPPRR